jgi:hypothetical protein
VKPESPQRTVVVHYHLFKCAGTSVETVLEQNFGQNLLRLDHEASFSRIFASELLEALDANDQITAVTSHQLKMPLPVKEKVKFLPLVFLRHPLDRILSVYRFDRRRGPVTPDAKIAAENTLAKYLRIQMDAQKQVVNFHVNSLTDAWDEFARRPLPLGAEAHLERALGVLEQLPVVGVVERFSESAEAYQDLVSASFPDFRFIVDAVNVDPNRSEHLDDRLYEMQEEAGEEIYQELSELNANDLHLYETANLHLDSVREKRGELRV